MLHIYDGKYAALARHLEGQATSPVAMTFGQIEQVLGFSLPESARRHQAWWANQGRGHSLAWQSVGYAVTALSVDEERLTFLKREQVTEFMDEPSADDADLAPLTIAEAKLRLAQTLGVDPSQIEITIRA